MSEKVIEIEKKNKEKIDKYHNLKKRRGELFSEISGNGEKIIELNKQFTRFANLIKERYYKADDFCESYLYWHALSGSGVDEEEFTKFDYPGDYSVENFLSLETEKEREELISRLEGKEIIIEE